jgi:acetolactate synthase small subunit
MEIPKNLALKRVTAIHDHGKKWPVEKKIEVVTKWLALGNLRLVAELTGVSYGNIRIWKMQPWWADLVAEIKATRDISVDNKLSKIIDRSLENIQDQLEHGELKYNRKTGEVVRVPVSALTANRIANDMIGRQIDISQKRVEETAQKQTERIEDTLKMLAQEFARFNTKRTVDVVAKEITDAIYEERKEGLREGTQVGPREWPSEGPGGEESSSSHHGEGGEGEQGGWEGRGSQDAYLQGWEDDEGESAEFESADSPQQPFIPAQ